MSVTPGVVILGAGQAGLATAVALRAEGWEGAIHLINAERHLPYQRPPLSKGYLAGTERDDELLLRSSSLIERDRITLHQQAAATRIDREGQQVTLSTGETLQYSALVFATGSRPRLLPVPGQDLAGIHTIRTIDDAIALKGGFAAGGHTLIVGAGFLGLEVASQARASGARVTVLAAGSQVLGRVLSKPTAEAILAHHQEIGVEVRFNVQVSEFFGSDGHVRGARLHGGEELFFERALVSVGATPRDELAQACGLHVDDGVVVDDRLATNDPSIFAIGDCAKYHNRFAGLAMRVESVQNATDQARYVAKQIATGVSEGYWAVPWFWSKQGSQNLQIAGIALPTDEARLVETQGPGKLVVERLRHGQVVAVETINAAGAHMKARRALARSAG